MSNFRTGDVLLVEGRGIIGTLIRVLTGQQISHVALVLNDKVVAEVREGKGFQMMSLVDWISTNEKGNRLYHGTAPAQVLQNPEALINKAQSFAGRRYSYWSLISVWFSQVFRRPLPSGLVCSTFVQAAWEATGFEFVQTPDPGDYIYLCYSVHLIRGDEA